MFWVFFDVFSLFFAIFGALFGPLLDAVLGWSFLQVAISENYFSKNSFQIIGGFLFSPWSFDFAGGDF